MTSRLEVPGHHPFAIDPRCRPRGRDRSPEGNAEAGANAGRRSSREVILALMDATGAPISRSGAQDAVLAEGLTPSAFKKVWMRLTHEGAIKRVPDGEDYIRGQSLPMTEG